MFVMPCWFVPALTALFGYLLGRLSAKVRP